MEQPAQPKRTQSNAAPKRSGFMKRALHARLKLVLAMPLLFAVVAASLTYAIPNRYVATARLQIDPRLTSLSDPAEASPANTQKRSIEDEIESIRSDATANDAIAHLTLPGDADLAGATPDTVLSKLSVRRVRNTQLVEIGFESPDPQKAARVANEIAKAYLRGHLASRWRANATDAETANAAIAPRDAPHTAPTADSVFAAMADQFGLNLQLPDARIVAMASPPANPAGPKHLRMGLLAALAGLAFAIATAAALELLVTDANAIRAIEHVLACPHLTSLPGNRLRESDAQSAGTARRVIGEPQGRYAEAVRRVCNALKTNNAHHPRRLILVVSAKPGEGSEDFASNVAHQLAVDGEAVLLVDADLRSKTLTRQLASQCGQGLLDQIASNGAMENAILRDGTTGLCFLPASGPAPIPLAISNVLRCAAFAGGVGALKDTFSTIVLSAPALATGDDANVIADIADQIIFVTAWGKTPPQVAAKALHDLGANQRKILGAVLTEVANHVDVSVMSFAEILDEIRDAGSGLFTRRAA